MIKPYTLTNNNDFRRIYYKGKSKASYALVTYAFPNRLGRTRCGITASKKVGNAVHRNRARRLVRESYRLIRDNVKPGYDIVFVCRARTPYVKCQDVQHSMKKQLSALNLLVVSNDEH